MELEVRLARTEATLNNVRMGTVLYARTNKWRRGKERRNEAVVARKELMVDALKEWIIGGQNH